jgi:hypothetical protein
MNISAALRRQARIGLGRRNLAVLCLFEAFLGDENVASSRPSPQPRSISGRQEKQPAGPSRFGSSVISILISTESAPSHDFNSPRERNALKLSTAAKASDFPLQARKDPRRFEQRRKSSVRMTSIQSGVLSDSADEQKANVRFESVGIATEPLLMCMHISTAARV